MQVRTNPAAYQQTRPDSGTASNRNTGDSAVTGIVAYSEDMPLPPGDIPGNVTPVPGDRVVVADVRVVETERTDDGYLLRTVYFLPGGDYCARLESSRIETMDRDIYVALNILEKRTANGVTACASSPTEGVTVMGV